MSEKAAPQPDLKRLRELLEKATSLPWSAGKATPIHSTVVWDAVLPARVDWDPVAYCNYSANDAALITEVVNALPALLDLAERNPTPTAEALAAVKARAWKSVPTDDGTFGPGNFPPGAYSPIPMGWAHCATATRKGRTCHCGASDCLGFIEPTFSEPDWQIEADRREATPNTDVVRAALALAEGLNPHAFSSAFCVCHVMAGGRCSPCLYRDYAKARDANEEQP